ncbi:hypothetical protein SRIMM317S_03293 [Streptomyces rimosus subsp. rimosus]
MNSPLPQDPRHTWLGAPIDARPLFAPEHAALMATVRGLAPADWGREAVPGWTVRDLVAHLLGDFYGRLSRDRDGHREGPAFAPGETLEAFIHRINQEWVDAFSRVSPAALTDTLGLVGGRVARFFEGADPHAPSLGVSWAGADPAPMWLDSARDLTEFWTHRQQIRHAAGQGTDPDPRLLSVVLDTFLRALPHTLREVAAPAGTQIQVRIDGPAGAPGPRRPPGPAGRWPNRPAHVPPYVLPRWYAWTRKPPGACAPAASSRTPPWPVPASKAAATWRKPPARSCRSSTDRLGASAPLQPQRLFRPSTSAAANVSFGGRSS